MLKQLAKRSFTTIKSNNDHVKDQTVLNLLKRLPALGEQRLKVKVKQEEEGVERIVSFSKLSRILQLHSSDPLNWNTDVLCRIFNVPEDYCDNILKYIHPFTRFASNESLEIEELDAIMYVIDVGRLKTDKLYYGDVQNLKFPDKQSTRKLVENNNNTQERIIGGFSDGR